MTSAVQQNACLIKNIHINCKKNKIKYKLIRCTAQIRF